ncbi:MAG: alcohol dehydrogenase catalytic domain-containing protein [Kiritimatiellia bacterium]|jgi:L-iditol 2-dehydrogenase|nr:alcohol dehydrogenase catalytic domain-containing protein [Kiritimatiellia bacterium]
MKAVVFYAPEDERVEDVPVPSAGEGEIRVRVDACAVCGSDLKAFHVGNPRIKPPMVIGHEFTGIIDEIGPDTTGYELGDRVVMATSVSCGSCVYCEKDLANLCANVAPMGYSYPGGMAEYVTVPKRAVDNGHVVKVPAGIKPEHAALAEPVSCAVNSCEQCLIKEGDTVLVMGAGPMGIMNACVARGMGASKIIMSEINESRLQQCDVFEFDELVNPGTQDLEEVVKAATGGIGADVVIVAAPAAQPQEQALSLVRKHGTVCLFASLPVGRNMLSLDSRLIHYGELRVVGTSDSRPEHVTTAVELIDKGLLPVDKLASHVMKLDDILEAYELMKTGEALRVVLVP